LHRVRIVGEGTSNTTQSCAQQDIISDIIHDVIHDIISHEHLYLTVLFPKLVACQVEGIASCLWPSTVALTLPLNAAECPKLSFATVAGDQVVFRGHQIVKQKRKVEEQDPDPVTCEMLPCMTVL
jgi:hypothetical protein